MKSGEGKKTKASVLGTLFTSMLYISAFTFGGGFVIVSLMERRFVRELHWLQEQEMLDYAALAQSSPGAIAVNAAILLGWHMAGFAGMLAAVLGTVLPPMLILGGISVAYEAFSGQVYIALMLEGMRAGVAAVILSVVCDLGKGVLRERSALHTAVMAAAFMAVYFLGIHVVVIILAAAGVGIAAQIWRHGRGRTP